MSNATAKDMDWRVRAYRRVNGTLRLTPKQRRRVVHKHNQVSARIATASTSVGARSEDV